MIIKEVKVPLTAGKLVDGNASYLGMRCLKDGTVGRFELYDINQCRTKAVLSEWIDIAGYKDGMGDWSSFFPRAMSDKGCYFICYAEKKPGDILRDTVIIECFDKNTYAMEARFSIPLEVGRIDHQHAIVDGIKVSADLYLVASIYKSGVGFEVFCYNKQLDTIQSLGIKKSIGNRPVSTLWFDHWSLVVQWGKKETSQIVRNCDHLRQEYLFTNHFTGIIEKEDGKPFIQYVTIENRDEKGYRFLSGIESVIQSLPSLFIKKARRVVRDCNTGNTYYSYDEGNRVLTYQWVTSGGDTLFCATGYPGKKPHSIIHVVAFDKGETQTLERESIVYSSIYYRMDEETGILYEWTDRNTAAFYVER